MRKLKVYEPKEIKTVYISGRITGIPLSEAKRNFEEAEALLLEKGYIPVNPMKNNHDPDTKGWIDHMLEDIGGLMRCDGIFMLNNWQQSKGARIEHYIAVEMDITVITKL
ncbi:uncharacterized protein DUF4406 [Dysgonomonas alginatilytica]|uniref:Uncharacterized protein DUF4406 n=1 Tax=Dysgonomonas alginatilytica TaxID=1605892 RepID=A0A2V3PM19_9BACT|nr:DUF4406 domain-containing protein [Dysgonomonas alginatilytica]PXV61234.1 uncharacterized protein DUF4406 [Dysgonomonas alginatilytica]